MEKKYCCMYKVWLVFCNGNVMGERGWIRVAVCAESVMLYGRGIDLLRRLLLVIFRSKYHDLCLHLGVWRWM